MTILSLILTVSMAHAAESWLCTSESSQVIGDQVRACGVGHGPDEDAARASALTSAKAEFQGLCNASSDCPSRAVTVEPKRTTCEQSGKGWKCFRLLVFTMGEKVKGGLRKVAKVGKHTPIGTATGEKGDYTSNDFWRDWNNKYLRPNQ